MVDVRVAPPGTTQAVAAPTPVRFGSRVCFDKGDVFELCAALALAESLLRRAGYVREAERLGDVFAVAEAGLAGCQRDDPADAPCGSKTALSGPSRR